MLVGGGGIEGNKFKKGTEVGMEVKGGCRLEREMKRWQRRRGWLWYWGSGGEGRK